MVIVSFHVAFPSPGDPQSFDGDPVSLELTAWPWYSVMGGGKQQGGDQFLQNSVDADLIRSVPGGPGGESVLDKETNLQEPGLKPHHAVRPVTISFVISLRHFN